MPILHPHLSGRYCFVPADLRMPLIFIKMPKRNKPAFSSDTRRCRRGEVCGMSNGIPDGGGWPTSGPFTNAGAPHPCGWDMGLSVSASLLEAVHCDSISTVPVSPVAKWRKLDHAHAAGSATSPPLTGLRCI